MENSIEKVENSIEFIKDSMEVRNGDGKKSPYGEDRGLGTGTI